MRRRRDLRREVNGYLEAIMAGDVLAGKGLGRRMAKGSAERERSRGR